MLKPTLSISASVVQVMRTQQPVAGLDQAAQRRIARLPGSRFQALSRAEVDYDPAAPERHVEACCEMLAALAPLP